MLQFAAVGQPTLELLRQLQSFDEHDKFILADGTALALIYGHRISEDLDFFTEYDFDTSHLIDFIKVKFQIQILNEAKNSLSLNINNIKTEFIRHAYPAIYPYVESENIRLYSCEDISAMKINSVMNRGSKKDFYDIYELLKHFDLQQLLSFYDKKYGLASHLIINKSLLYFEDAETEPDPLSLGNITWNQVKQRIISVVETNF
jgi:predicted nucleotidyltransferase component of viral defense system